MDSSVIFDRNLIRQRRDRAAFYFAAHNFLFEEIASRLIERLQDIKRPFSQILDLGAHNGILSQKLKLFFPHSNVTACELSPTLCHHIASHGISVVCADEENLPFAPQSFETIISNLSLHWVNDIPGSLVQIRQALKPGGFFLTSMLGGRTLEELRESLLIAEETITGGASPRISPLVRIQDAAALIQRAGFTLPVVDHDLLTVTYAQPSDLLKDLRGTGASNALLARSRKPLRRSILLKAFEHYANHHQEPDGRVKATFQVFYLAGWAPG